MENPLISVIVPIYNVEQYLRECLDSVMAQTLKEIQIICVNDGSTDSCREILDEYVKKDARIEVIHKQNTGYGNTMNVGMRRAVGEYIGILESDDYIREDMYEILYKAAKEEDLDYLKSSYLMFYEEQSGVKHFLEKKYIQNSAQETSYGKLCELGMQKGNWSGIYKRKYLEDNRITHHESAGASYQDVGFNFLNALLSKKYKILDIPLYRYRIDNPNASMKSKSKVNAIIKEYEYLEQVLKERGIKDSEYLKACYHMCIAEVMELHILRVDESLIYQLAMELHDYIKVRNYQLSFGETTIIACYKEVLELLMETPEAFVELVLQRRKIKEAKFQQFMERIDLETNIIIYGAGVIGRFVYSEFFSKHRSDIVTMIATTKRSDEANLCNIPIKKLADLQAYKEEAYVIVSGGKKIVTEMKTYARACGFKNIVAWDEVFCTSLW